MKFSNGILVFHLTMLTKFNLIVCVTVVANSQTTAPAQVLSSASTSSTSFQRSP